ncbi:MAG TPA: RNA polymerase sigma factor [Acidimicrobiia bacterium]|nr:RNA polymerase sigma factor [Acidimicrobiia bacterium]
MILLAAPVLLAVLASVARPTELRQPSPSNNDVSGEAFDSVVDAARVGAEWAWTRLVTDIDPVLRGYLARQGSSDVDDLAGETWLHVARGISRFEGDYDNFRSWVFMVGHHRIIDERRRRRRRPADPTESEKLLRHVGTVISAENEVMDQAETDTILGLLEELTVSQREVVLLRVMGGFGVAEIAGIIGKKPGAVQALQHRAFRRLERILEKGVWK